MEKIETTGNRNSERITFNVSFGKRLTLFICITVMCYLCGSLLIGLLIHFKGATTAMLRISAVLQDVIIFIVPAILTAVLITRLPARFLSIEHAPRKFDWILACLVLLVSIPLINAIVAWNESIVMPDCLSGVERWMRQAEEAAKVSIGNLIGGTGIGSLIVSILIVGVLAGLSEEIFFRGGMQRLFSTGGLNAHAAIWLVAFIFSATHLQFYGFFGRLLLGAYFGYLLYWFGNLWIPVIVHILNNTLYLIGNFYFGEGKDFAFDIGNFGSEDLVAAIVSLFLVVAGLRILYLRRAKKAESRIRTVF